MHRFIGTSLRSVTAEYSRSTWRPTVPDDVTIGGHFLDSLVFAGNLTDLTSSAPRRGFPLGSPLESRFSNRETRRVPP